MADEANKTTAPTPTASPAPAKTEAPAKKPVKEAKLEEYETTGDFQLFDVSTRTMVPHDGTAKLMNTNPFVIDNLKKKKLKKVG